MFSTRRWSCDWLSGLYGPHIGPCSQAYCPWRTCARSPIQSKTYVKFKMFKKSTDIPWDADFPLGLTAWSPYSAQFGLLRQRLHSYRSVALMVEVARSYSDALDISNTVKSYRMGYIVWGNAIVRLCDKPLVQVSHLIWSSCGKEWIRFTRGCICNVLHSLLRKWFYNTGACIWSSSLIVNRWGDNHN